MMKQSFILGALILAACQPSAAQKAETSAPQITAINAPASDDIETLDKSLLPEGFPLIGEIKSSAAPAGCALTKSSRAYAQAGMRYDEHYVFTAKAGGDYQISINGELRSLRQTGSADAGETTTRYFKTVDGAPVEVMVSYTQSENGLAGIVGRIKAWDDGLPLMCGYNRISVTGECDL